VTISVRHKNPKTMESDLAIVKRMSAPRVGPADLDWPSNHANAQSLLAFRGQLRLGAILAFVGLADSAPVSEAAPGISSQDWVYKPESNQGSAIDDERLRERR